MRERRSLLENAGGNGMPGLCRAHDVPQYLSGDDHQPAQDVGSVHAAPRHEIIMVPGRAFRTGGASSVLRRATRGNLARACAKRER